MLEENLDIYDVWEAPSGNLFIKMSDEHSLAIGAKGHHSPNDFWDPKRSNYVRSDNVTKVKKIGKIVFD